MATYKHNKDILEEFKQQISKDLKKVPQTELSSSMTTTKTTFSNLWRPNNYRRQIEVKSSSNSAKNKIMSTIPFINDLKKNLNQHTNILSIKNYKPNITIQYAKNHLIGIYSQSKIGNHKETYLIEAQTPELLDKRLDEKKIAVKERIDRALRDFCRKFNINLPFTRITWLRHEDWVKGEDFIDNLPKETIIHDTYFKKVYGEGIEFIGGKDKEPTVGLKNYIKNRAIENIAPEIASELNHIRGSMMVFAEGMQQHMKLISVMQNTTEGLKQTQDAILKPKRNINEILDNLFKEPHKFNKLSRKEKDRRLFEK